MLSCTLSDVLVLHVGLNKKQCANTLCTDVPSQPLTHSEGLAPFLLGSTPASSASVRCRRWD